MLLRTTLLHRDESLFSFIHFSLTSQYRQYILCNLKNILVEIREPTMNLNNKLFKVKEIQSIKQGGTNIFSSSGFLEFRDAKNFIQVIMKAHFDILGYYFKIKVHSFEMLTPNLFGEALHCVLT